MKFLLYLINYEVALKLYKTGQLTESEKQFRQLLSEDLHSESAWLTAAKKFLIKIDFKLNLESGIPYLDAIEKLADYYYKKTEQFEKAVYAYHKLIKTFIKKNKKALEEKQPEPRTLLGNAYWSLAMAVQGTYEKDRKENKPLAHKKLRTVFNLIKDAHDAYPDIENAESCCWHLGELGKKEFDKTIRIINKGHLTTFDIERYERALSHIKNANKAFSKIPHPTKEISKVTTWSIRLKEQLKRNLENKKIEKVLKQEIKDQAERLRRRKMWPMQIIS